MNRLSVPINSYKRRDKKITGSHRKWLRRIKHLFIYFQLNRCAYCCQEFVDDVTVKSKNRKPTLDHIVPVVTLEKSDPRLRRTSDAIFNVVACGKCNHNKTIKPLEEAFDNYAEINQRIVDFQTNVDEARKHHRIFIGYMNK